MHPITTQFLTFFLGAATLHGIYLAILLVFKNGKTLSNRLLGLSIFSFSLYLLNYLLFLTGIINHFPHLLGLLYFSLFLVGPGFYFFVKSTLDPSFRWKRIHAIHLLPLAYAGWRTIRILQVSAARKLAYIQRLMAPEGYDFSWSDFLLGTLVVFLLLAYLIAAWRLCIWALQTPNNEANLKSIQWLKNFCTGFIALVIIDLLVKFIAFSTQIPVFAMEYILAALIAIAIHIAGYFAIGGLPKIQPLNGKYKTSSLDQTQIQLFQARLLEVLEEKQPYLLPDLKIADLANLLHIPSHQLSQILSEGLQASFSDLINQYRIEEVKRRLVHPKFQHFSILAIALDCGFNNKATFNRVFKKATGMTPSGYMESVN